MTRFVLAVILAGACGPLIAPGCDAGNSTHIKKKLHERATKFANELALADVKCSFDIDPGCGETSNATCVGITANRGAVFFDCGHDRCSITAAGTVISTGAEESR